MAYDPEPAAATMGKMAHCWFPDAFTPAPDPLPEAPAFHHLFAGLVSLADWLGSDQKTFGPVEALDESYFEQSLHKARQRVTAIGLGFSSARREMGGRSDFYTLTGHRTPRPQQALVDACPYDEPLVILEAETGSGKTESALWRFARLFEKGQVDSLFFAVPTRAAAAQLHGRVHAAMKRLFRKDAPETVLAVPGYLKAGDAVGTALPNWHVRWDDEQDADEGRLQARWAAESSRRFLAAPVAVGTVDQVLLAGLCVKHAHLRAASLARSFLVIDEVHASDRYMTEILDHVLRFHSAVGGYAMLMSATLGAKARARWLDQPLPTFTDARTTAYPAVSLSREPAPRTVSETGRIKTVTMSIIATMAADTVAEQALAAARAGARVLVIRNTTTAAIQTWEAVQELGESALLLTVNHGPALHHSRFAANDRRSLDRAVEEALAPKAPRPGGVIVIGTQTLEQSLDIDADTLFTDLCPIDVLLQRMGRLHRHPLPRPDGFDRPACHVMVPKNGLDPLVAPAFENGLGGWIAEGILQGIYRDVPILELTRRLIAEQPEWSIPTMNRDLVESGTHPDRIDALIEEKGDNWSFYANNVYGKDIADAVAARHILLPYDTEFQHVTFPTKEEKIRTRLGGDGAKIIFESAFFGPFGNAIDSIVLPAHYSYRIESAEPVAVTGQYGIIEFSCNDMSFRYDRRGLTRLKNGD